MIKIFVVLHFLLRFTLPFSVFFYEYVIEKKQLGWHAKCAGVSPTKLNIIQTYTPDLSPVQRLSYYRLMNERDECNDTSMSVCR